MSGSGQDRAARPRRRLPVGAEVQPGGGVHFRVWAPRRRQVEVVLEGGPGPAVEVELAAEPGGYFAGSVAGAGAGTRYRYRLDGEGRLLPDPASRYQPEGPLGASEVVDPARFRWSDAGWRGLELPGQVLYELHVGTFTTEGTWAAAGRELPRLAELGITAISLMPVNEFSGQFGWGYDGVNLFAPTRLYGAPDDFRCFVDAAHAAGIGVILDVVYNHFGPEDNTINAFSADYCSERHHTDWGAAINFDGECSGPVREFFIANAGYWVEEFHVDGLRLDATQNIYDDSPTPILAEITRRVRTTGAAAGRGTLLFTENESQDVRQVRPIEAGGYGLDALWNDDFHHAVRVALTGRNEAYYCDYLGTPQELISAVRWGYLYQGQRYRWYGGGRRGTPALDLPPTRFVTFIQNHDQIANSGRGERIHRLTSPGRYRAATALLLLAPGTPMLFQGQEYAAANPFLYFADHRPELAALVREGRIESLGRFSSLRDPAMRPYLPDPDAPETFRRCQLDHAERERPGHAEVYALHRDLLRLRRQDPVFRAQAHRGIDGAVLGPGALVLRFFDPERGPGGTEDRLLIVNLGVQLDLYPVPEPLLAPPAGREWALRWSSEDPRYGGCGTPPLEPETGGWQIPGEAAVVLGPRD